MPGLWYSLVVAVCVVEVAASARALNERLIRFFLFFGIGLIHGLVPLLGPDYRIASWQPSLRALEQAPLLTFAGVAAMSLAWRITDHVNRGDRHPERPRVPEAIASNQRQLQRIAFAAGALGVAGMLGVFILSAGSVSAYVEGSRFEFRFTGGPLAVVALQFIALAAVPGFLAFMLRRRVWRYSCVAYAIGFSGFYYLATRGTRSIPMGVLGALLVGFIIARRPSRSMSLVAITATVLSVFLAVGLYTVRRDLGSLSVVQAATRLVEVDTYRDAVNTDPLNYHGAFLAAIDLFPDEHRYLYGATYRRILLAPIPVALAGGLKPEDTHITFGETIAGPGTALSVPPSIPGDGYINFGGALGTVFIMAIWGGLGALADRALSRRTWTFLWLGPNLVRVSLLFLRGQPYELLVISTFMFLSMVGLARVYGLRLRRPPRSRPEARATRLARSSPATRSRPRATIAPTAGPPSRHHARASAIDAGS